MTIMRLRELTFVLATVTLVASACITEGRPVLLISLDPPPPTTVEDPEFNVIGVVVRAPPDPLAVFTLTAITTSPDAVDTTAVLTGSAGNFTVRIPIARDTIGIPNDVVLIATDDTEDAISNEAAFRIIGIREGAVFRRGND